MVDLVLAVLRDDAIPMALLVSRATQTRLQERHQFIVLLYRDDVR